MNAGDAEGYRDLRVGQQPAEGVEALVLAQRGSPGGLHRGYGEGGRQCRLCMAQLRKALKQVRLCSLFSVHQASMSIWDQGEGGVPLAEPVEERGRVYDLLGGEAADAWRDVALLGAGSQPGQDAPSREEPDRLDVLRVLDAGQCPASISPQGTVAS
ncbi:hypothetical protein AB0M31_20840 [Streptomyces sp. NPDC051773]|uniref:hypothetical protein n=1 Tax=Streptomyces sp. NPDC051773 TaxID=3156682 RepID=UPI0034299DC1